jgi:hypothetical protein
MTFVVAHHTGRFPQLAHQCGIANRQFSASSWLPARSQVTARTFPASRDKARTLFFNLKSCY